MLMALSIEKYLVYRIIMMQSASSIIVGLLVKCMCVVCGQCPTHDARETLTMGHSPPTMRLF